MEDAPSLTFLIVGGGGREHALVRRCARSPRVRRVLAAPGNGGMAADGEVRPVAADDLDGLVELAAAESVDLAVIGPEDPLSRGLADALRARGIDAFGPSAAAARLEASKAFCKDFLARHGIPTADYARFTELQPALDHLRERPAPIVVKASGLAAGKGVVVAETRDEAEHAARDMLEGGKFGASGREIVIEECLRGEEVSVHALVSGAEYRLLPTSQDHKRAGENDTGPNTGGMGAYAPAPAVDGPMLAEIERRIVRPVLEGMASDGLDYRGVLYAGLMLTENGPRVLEFNVRFGDPETQAVLPLVDGDLVPFLLAAARGEPLPGDLHAADGSALVVVVGAEGYPGPYRKDQSIRLPEDLPESVEIFHAGTRRADDGSLRSAGGRVLGVAARAPRLRDAAERVYAACDRIDYADKYFRHDIGARALHREAQRSS